MFFGSKCHHLARPRTLHGVCPSVLSPCEYSLLYQLAVLTMRLQPSPFVLLLKHATCISHQYFWLPSSGTQTAFDVPCVARLGCVFRLIRTGSLDDQPVPYRPGKCGGCLLAEIYRETFPVSTRFKIKIYRSVEIPNETYGGCRKLGAHAHLRVGGEHVQKTERFLTFSFSPRHFVCSYDRRPHPVGAGKPQGAGRSAARE